MHIYLVIKKHLTSSGIWRIDSIPHVFQLKTEAENCCEVKNLKKTNYLYVVETKFIHPPKKE